MTKHEFRSGLQVSANVHGLQRLEIVDAAQPEKIIAAVDLRDAKELARLILDKIDQAQIGNG